MGLEGVKLIRIRWEKGTERIPIKNMTTIGDLIEYMAKKYPKNVRGSNLTLTQDRTKTIYQKRAKLESIDLENGELFVLLLPTSRAATPSSTNSHSIDPFTKEFNPAEDSSCNDNVMTVKKLSALHPVIKYAKESEIKRVWFSIGDIDGIKTIANALHFNSTRVMLLYGTHVNKESFSIHATTMPSQNYDGKNLTINENHVKSSNDLAKEMGLSLIGALLIAPKGETQFPAPVFLKLASILIEKSEEFVLVRVSPSLANFRQNDLGIGLEGYTVSEQFVKLYKEGLFNGETTDTSCITKSSVSAGGKLGNEVDVSFFITPVPIMKRKGWFPRSSFPYQCFYPTVADFASTLERDFQVPDFVRLLDFNLLLYLEALFSREKDIPIIIKKCINKEEMPYNVITKIDQIIRDKVIK